jgi:hypothetical protein
VTDADASAGTYTYTVTAVYNSWKASTTSAAITVLAAPTLTSTPANPSANTSPTVGFAGAGVSYQCALDSTTFTACTSPQSLKALNANTPLTAGAHTFKVHAVQGRSTGADISYAWTLNTSAPTIGSSPPSISASTSPSVAFSHSAYGTFKCQLDGGGFTTCTSPASYIGLASGAHTFQVEAIDSDGVATSAAVYSWTINTSAPTITSQPTSPSLSASASFSFSHPVYSSYRCQLDSGGFQACTSPTAYTRLSSGWHSFQVKAVDAAGAETSAASHSWFVIAIFPGANTSGQAATSAAAPNLGAVRAANGQRARAAPQRSRACKRPAKATRPPARRSVAGRPPRARSIGCARASTMPRNTGSERPQGSSATVHSPR